MLIKPTIFQLGAASLNKVLGFLITAFLYRLYTLEEIGEYFLLISVLSVLVALQHIGSDKPLMRYNIKAQKKNEYRVIKTKILVSLTFVPIFFYISLNLFQSTTLFVTIILALALFLSSITLDYLLIAKKKFLEVSIITILVQLVLFSFFGLSIYFNLKPNIVFHQFIPTLLLTVSIFIVAQKITKINLKKIIFSKIVSIDYFKNNKIIIISVFFIGAITSADFIVAKNVLNYYELGIISGLYRYCMMSYGFLLIMSRILFSFSISTLNNKNFKTSRKQLIVGYKAISVFGLLILLYPYLKYAMNLDEIYFIVFPGIIITLSTFFMPGFFLELNKIESNDQKVSFKTFLIFIIATLLIYYLVGYYFVALFPETTLYNFLSIIFIGKWIVLNLGITYVRKQSNIK